LREQRYAVVRGQGGEGKTALAAEFARWMVRSQQMHRAAFVSVETYGNQRAVVDALGKQLVKKEFSAAGNLEDAIQEIERTLREQPSLLVIDNMETVLLPPFMKEDTPEALSADAAEELKAILALCEQLLKVGETRVVFTSREALPSPFDAARNRRELHQLDREDAVKLVERVLNASGDNAGASSDAAREEIEQLVDAVHCHARTLALLAPSLREQGVDATRQSLVKLMAEMEKNFPGSRDRSVFASVELSLRRMSQANRDRTRVLGVFHGGVYLGVLQAMMQWEKEHVVSLASELVQTGLATPNRHDHLTLNPALCPYLRGRMEAAERETLTARWVAVMRSYIGLLVQQRRQNVELAATLTMLELPNLFALLEIAQHAWDAATTIDLATSLYQLLQSLGKPQLLARVGDVRDTAASALSDVWNHTQFDATRSRIEQQLASRRLQEALTGAQQLLHHARLSGEQAYLYADYDVATAFFLLARVLIHVGRSEQALPLLDESRQRFEGIAKVRLSKAAENMAAKCFSEQGACLWLLGRLDEAAAAYEERIRRAKEVRDDRGIAVAKAQIGSIRSDQRRYSDALEALAEARERFMLLDEHRTVSVIWHQIGMVYQDMSEPEAAEDAYRKSLAITLRAGNVANQADTLGQLGNLYDDLLDRPEEAVTFYRQAADLFTEGGFIAKEGAVRTNLAKTLYKLRRFDDARREISRAIECNAQFGHASMPWKTWAVLTAIETDSRNPAAATEAKHNAIDSYLAYRRDGGENHDLEGRLSLEVTQFLLTGDDATAASLLHQLAADPDLPSHLNTYIRALQAVVAGNRDRSLADAPDLDYGMAAEILLLIETIEKGG